MMQAKLKSKCPLVAMAFTKSLALQKITWRVCRSSLKNHFSYLLVQLESGTLCLPRWWQSLQSRCCMNLQGIQKYIMMQAKLKSQCPLVAMAFTKSLVAMAARQWPCFCLWFLPPHCHWQCQLPHCCWWSFLATMFDSLFFSEPVSNHGILWRKKQVCHSKHMINLIDEVNRSFWSILHLNRLVKCFFW